VEKNRDKCCHYAVGNTATLALASQRLLLLYMALNHPYLANATTKEKVNVQFDKNQLQATPYCSSQRTFRNDYGFRRNSWTLTYGS
jgi:hypothetical protein